MKKGERMLNVHEAAERLGAGVGSVRVWAWKGRFAGARKETTPLGDYWLIPESALEGFELSKPGPKPKADKGKHKGKA
jgi:helix-turn-helix protein